EPLDDLGPEPEVTADGFRCLPRPPQCAGEELVELLVGQPLGEELGLVASFGGERGVGRPVCPHDPLGETVADQQQLHVPDRSLPPMPESGADRVLTLPNLVSVIRLLCAPLFLWLLFGQHERAGAAFLLGGLGTTDWIDGYLARHLGQVSTVGKVLDPVAD